MANCMAVALGSPKDSNHLYPRIFTPKELENTYGPGSDHGHKNWDCGYQLSHDGQLTNRFNIMGNNRQYRLALNTLVWSALSWCTLIDKNNANLQACQTNDHFLNYWQKDGAVAKNNAMRQRTDSEMIRYYIVVRAQSFFGELIQDPEMLEQHIDATHFITECLFNLWELINNNGKPGDRNKHLKSIYKSEAEAIEYETYLKNNVFDNVKGNYVKLKKQFQDAAHGNNHMQTIYNVQNYQSLYFPSPLMHYQTFVNKFGEIALKLENNDELKELRVLSQFVKERNRIGALQYLPELVYFYQLINRLFAFRLSTEESLQYTVPQAIDLLRKYEEPDVITHVENQWKSFQHAWQIIREILAELVGCPDQQRNRQFESYILQLSDDTLIANLLSHGQNVDTYDEVIKLIIALLQLHDNMITLLSTDHYKDLNFCNLLYETSDQPLPLESLPYDVSYQFLLVTGDVKFNDNKINGTEFELFALSQMSMDPSRTRASLNFDWSRIEKEVIHRYLSGRAMFADVKRHFRQPFSFRLELPAELLPAAQPNKPEVVDNQNTGVQSLVQSGITKNSRFGVSLDDDEVTSVSVSLRDLHEGDIHKVADFIKHIIQRLKEVPMENAPQLTLEEAAQQLLFTDSPYYLRTINQVKLCHLKHLAELVVERSAEKDFLFKMNGSLPVPKDAKAQLEKLQDKLLSKQVSSDEQSHWVTMLQLIIEHLRTADSKNKLKENPRKSIYEIFSETIQAWTKSYPKNDIDLLLPVTINPPHYTNYMKFIHRLCGAVVIRIQTKKITEAKVTYVEYIPKEAPKQIELPLSAAVPFAQEMEPEKTILVNEEEMEQKLPELPNMEKNNLGAAEAKPPAEPNRLSIKLVINNAIRQVEVPPTTTLSNMKNHIDTLMKNVTGESGYIICVKDKGNLVIVPEEQFGTPLNQISQEGLYMFPTTIAVTIEQEDQESSELTIPVHTTIQEFLNDSLKDVEIDIADYNIFNVNSSNNNNEKLIAVEASNKLILEFESLTFRAVTKNQSKKLTCFNGDIEVAVEISTTDTISTLKQAIATVQAALLDTIQLKKGELYVPHSLGSCKIEQIYPASTKIEFTIVPAVAPSTNPNPALNFATAEIARELQYTFDGKLYLIFMYKGQKFQDIVNEIAWNHNHDPKQLAMLKPPKSIIATSTLAMIAIEVLPTGTNLIVNLKKK